MEEVEVEEATEVKEEKRWCVYMHTNKENGKVYIGTTSTTPHRRWGVDGSRYTKSQQVFYRAIQKYGWDNFEHEIIADNLTHDEAITMERDMIALYKSNCRKYQNPSFGYNQTDGGEGLTGYVYTEEQRKRKSDWAKARFSTDEWRNRVRELMTGRKVSEEHKEKLKYLMGKAVVQLDLYGKYIAEYDSALQAYQITGIDDSSIRKCCNGKLKNAGGFLWVNLSKWRENQKDISAEKVRQNGAPIVQLDLMGKFIKQYISAKEASKMTGIRTGSITSCCNHHKKSAGGYVWVFLDEYLDGFQPNFIVIHNRAIVQLSMDDNFIAEYNTVIEADRTLGINQSSIIKCCKGKQHSACGFKWMYKEDYEKFLETKQNDLN